MLNIQFLLIPFSLNMQTDIISNLCFLYSIKIGVMEVIDEDVYFIYGEHLLRNGVRHSENRRDDVGPSHLSKTY